MSTDTFTGTNVGPIYLGSLSEDLASVVRSAAVRGAEVTAIADPGSPCAASWPTELFSANELIRWARPVLDLDWQLGRPDGPWVTAWDTSSRTAVHVLADVDAAAELCRPGFLRSGQTPTEAAEALGRWEELSGTPWRGTPGMTGTALMVKHATGHPRWQPIPRLELDGKWDDHDVIDWHAEQPQLPEQTVTTDVRYAYLAAAGTCPLPVGQLRRLGPVDYQRVRSCDEAGWFLIRVPAWNERRCPPPTTMRARVGARLWVTTPTLHHLAELDAAGLVEFPRIEDSWTSPNAKRVLRGWAEKLRDVLAATAVIGDPELHDAAKQTYRESIGLLGRSGTRIQRPDWRAHVIAHARANLLRKILRVAAVERIWPVAVDVDSVTWPRLPELVRERIGAGPGAWRMVTR